MESFGNNDGRILQIPDFSLKKGKTPKRIQSFTKNLEIIKKISKTSTGSESLQKIQEISGFLPKIWLNLIPNF